MNLPNENNSYPQNEVAKDVPRFKDFTNSVYKELETFDVEEQAEILSSLYRMLKDKYQCTIEESLKKAESFKSMLEVIMRLEPNK